MSHDGDELQPDLAVQRRVARIALDAVDGFVLAGSGAIREHGVIDRPTEDIDLFTISQDVAEFGEAVDRVTEQLRRSGFTVDEVRRAPQFARLPLLANDGSQVDVDLGVDWRRYDPVEFDVGPVLNLIDAVGNKVSALYSRGEPRNYIDVDAICSSGCLTDEELIDAAAERDAGFEVRMFAQQLAGVRRITPRDVRGYGVTPEQLDGVKERLARWAASLQH